MKKQFLLALILLICIQTASAQLAIESVKATIDHNSERIYLDETVDIKPNSKIKLFVKIQNTNPWSNKITIEDIRAQTTIYGISGRLTEYQELGTLEADDNGQLEFDFVLPKDLEEGTYKVIIVTDGEQDDRHVEDSFRFYFEADKKTHDIVISKMDVIPGKCRFLVDIEINNFGTEKEEDVVLELKNNNILKKETLFLDKAETGQLDSSFQRTYAFDAEDGEHLITATTYYNTNRLSNSETKKVNVDCNEISTSASAPTITQPPETYQNYIPVQTIQKDEPDAMLYFLIGVFVIVFLGVMLAFVVVLKR